MYICISHSKYDLVMTDDRLSKQCFLLLVEEMSFKFSQRLEVPNGQAKGLVQEVVMT